MNRRHHLLLCALAGSGCARSPEPTGFEPPSSNGFRLRLENAANPEQWTEAGPFTIRGAH
jgi:hypothetical protein